MPLDEHADATHAEALGAWRRVARRVVRKPWPPTPGPPPSPPLAMGLRVGPPDFVGIGGQRCGTSWWFALLLRHPRVHHVRGQPKELHFFSRFWHTDFTDVDAGRYHQYFPREEGTIVGEWTPRYSADPWTPGLLRRVAPEAKLLMMVRDPIDRYLSGIAFDLARGAPLAGIVANRAFSFGLYAQQLGHVFRHFDPSRVLILQHEECRRVPMHALARTWDFLGIPHGPQPSELERRRNATVGAKPTLSERARADLVTAYEDSVLELCGLVPDLDLSLWPNFAHLARGDTERTWSGDRDGLAQAPP